MRSGEAQKLTWAVVDVERKIIRVTAEKGSNPRIFKVSSQLTAMLNGLSKTATFVFGKVKYNSFRGTSDDVRIRIAQKLKNPRLQQIHFHTLRH